MSSGGGAGAGAGAGLSHAELHAERRKEKVKKVSDYRTAMLARVNKPQGGKATAERKTETFVAPVRYENVLPEVPADLRYIAYPFDEDVVWGFDQLNGVSSEAAAPRQFHAEPDLGLSFVAGLIDPAQYTLPDAAAAAAPRDPIDVQICSAEYAKPAVKRKDVTHESRQVEWLMLSQHLHNNLYDSVYKHGDTVRTQHVALERKRNAMDASHRSKTREQHIEASFAAAAALDAAQLGATRHPLNPRLTARRSWSVLPDADTAGLPLIAVAFDADPDDAPERRARRPPLPPLAPGVKRARLERALIRTAPAQPVDKRTSSVAVHFLLPRPEDVVLPGAGAGVGAGDTATSDAVWEALYEYAMAVDKPPQAGAVGAGEESVAFRWDDAHGEVLFSPIIARAALTRVKAAGAAAAAAAATAAAAAAAAEDDEDAAPAAAAAAAAAALINDGSAILAPRGLTEEELDVREEAHALASEGNPSATRLRVALRRRERAEAVKRLEVEAARAAEEQAAAAAAAAAATAVTVAAPAAAVADLEDDFFDREE